MFFSTSEDAFFDLEIKAVFLLCSLMYKGRHSNLSLEMECYNKLLLFLQQFISC